MWWKSITIQLVSFSGICWQPSTKKSKTCKKKKKKFIPCPYNMTDGGDYIAFPSGEIDRLLSQTLFYFQFFWKKKKKLMHSRAEPSSLYYYFYYIKYKFILNSYTSVSGSSYSTIFSLSLSHYHDWNSWSFWWRRTSSPLNVWWFWWQQSCCVCNLTTFLPNTQSKDDWMFVSCTKLVVEFSLLVIKRGKKHTHTTQVRERETKVCVCVCRWRRIFQPIYEGRGRQQLLCRTSVEL